MTNVSSLPWGNGPGPGTGSGVRFGSRLRRYVDSSGDMGRNVPRTAAWTAPRSTGDDQSMRSIWKGAISFGLVTIPVKLYSATEEKDVSFHQVRRSDGSRIRYKRVAQSDGEEVPYGEIAKGYELPNGETVVLTDEDFADLPLTTNRAIDVLQFVPLEEVDPIYFE